MKICTSCSVACLEPHPELIWWKKCPICGYSALVLEELSPPDQIRAKEDPMCPIPELVPRKRELHDRCKTEEPVRPKPSRKD